MNHVVDFYELLAATGISIASAIGAYVKIRENITTMKQDINYVKKELDEEKQSNKINHSVLTDKIDLLLVAVNDLKISLATQEAKTGRRYEK